MLFVELANLCGEKMGSESARCAKEVSTGRCMLAQVEVQFADGPESLQEEQLFHMKKDSCMNSSLF